MKDEKLIDQLIRERIAELVERPVLSYEALAEGWEELVQGGDSGEPEGLYPYP